MPNIDFPPAFLYDKGNRFQPPVHIENLTMESSKKYIYIVLSRTQTGFARILQTFGGLNYNHAAIALDQDLQELYAFARTEQYGYLTARLVRETTDRYLVNARGGIPILVYKLPVTEVQLNWVRTTIKAIHSDPKYRYNLLSVLTYPLFGGFSIYKAFSCIEFVAWVLQHLGYEIGTPLPRCRPDDLRPLLAKFLCYDGNLLSYTPTRTYSPQYFRSVTPDLIYHSVLCTASLLHRSIPGMRRI